MRRTPPDSQWRANLAQADRLYEQGFPDEASTIARAVYDDALREREHHRLGTGERWVCTRTAALASAALQRFFAAALSMRG